MKRRSLTLLAAAACLSLTTSWVSAETTLRLTLQLPMKHHLGQNVADFKEEVESKTGGEVKVQIFPSAQLYKDKEVPQAVSSGAIEMGVASLTRFAGTVPAVDAFYVPFLFDSSEKVAAATAPESPIRQALDAEVLKTGARILWWQAFGGAVVLSKGDAPITVPADMKGKKVRVFGKTIGDTVTQLEGAPTMMSGSKQFLAYQRGTVDAGMTGITAVKSRKLYDVMDNVTMTNHADIEFVALINEGVWSKLSPEHQKVISEAAARVEKELRDKITGLEKQALEDVRGKMNVVELTEEQRQQWRDATKPVVDAYVERAGELGAMIVEEAGKL